MAALISLMIVISLLGAILTFLTKTRKQARTIALITSLVSFALSLILFSGI